ncbi:hypothetical protein PYCCODRAFT_1435084 [Trametes coccinea BRFM310]|uniref:Uncharacterized protein n=1 Tax=Trametes coccinea (strain BRFM310) TaxID=1353009 RepID=A0A1Y2ICH1_TRAC3|nr:hypothetical protein PYCCODRAFT_1439989 [Trametes coccinea BRFM310]OSD02804.1 hypothetical protein PYCCODRAFT_1435084 [Trametes coccinea BRFM310]
MSCIGESTFGVYVAHAVISPRKPRRSSNDMYLKPVPVAPPRNPPLVPSSLQSYQPPP